jgi:hypothetical protein
MKLGRVHKILTDVAHVLVGFLTGVACVRCCPLAVLMFAGYVLYQVVDSMCEGDLKELKEDILEYMVGYIISVVAYLLFMV